MRTRQLHGPLQLIVRAGWLVLAVFLLGTYAAGVVVRWNHLQQPIRPGDPVLMAGLSPALEAAFTGRLAASEVEALRDLGLSLPVYAATLLAFELTLALACTLIAMLIFWRRSDDWFAVWLSLLILLLGTNGITPEGPSLILVWPGALLVTTAVGFLGMISNVHILFLSPDGRFVPRWTRGLAAGFTGAMLAIGVYVIDALARGHLLNGLLFFVLATFTWVGQTTVGVFSQVYRYRRVSGPVQRQQTKWLVVGLAAAALGFLLHSLELSAAAQTAGQARVLINLAGRPAALLCMLLLPVCLAFSIFRYRLWDIDLLIRRTLIYSGLTAALAAVYFSSIVLLQAVFGALTGQRESPLVTVVSTLALAVLFGPARRGVQNLIDRLFYRRKYDAAQTLAAFSVSVRDETDLEQLTARLLSGVDEAMQPAAVSLWLRPKAAPEKP